MLMEILVRNVIGLERARERARERERERDFYPTD